MHAVAESSAHHFQRGKRRPRHFGTQLEKPYTTQVQACKQKECRKQDLDRGSLSDILYPYANLEARPNVRNSCIKKHTRRRQFRYSSKRSNAQLTTQRSSLYILKLNFSRHTVLVWLHNPSNTHTSAQSQM